MCPFTKGVGGAHLKRARVASIPTLHPGYSLLGFRVLPPNPPSKEGFCVFWGALTRLSPQALAQTGVRVYAAQL